MDTFIKLMLANSLNKLWRELKDIKTQITSIGNAYRSEQNKHQSNPPPIIAELHEPQAIVDQKEAREHRRERRETRQGNRDRTRLLVESGGVFVAIVIAALTWRSVNIAGIAAEGAQKSAGAAEIQVGISQKAINATIDQFQLDQRAWVSVEPEVGPNGHTFSIAMSNSGKTPALYVSSPSFSFSVDKQLSTEVVKRRTPQHIIRIPTPKEALNKPVSLKQ